MEEVHVEQKAECCTSNNREDREERLERQLCMIFAKLIDIESRLERFELDRALNQTESELKEANWKKADIENQKMRMWDRYSDQRKAFRDGHLY